MPLSSTSPAEGNKRSPFLPFLELENIVIANSPLPTLTPCLKSKLIRSITVSSMLSTNILLATGFKTSNKLKPLVLFSIKFSNPLIEFLLSITSCKPSGLTSVLFSILSNTEARKSLGTLPFLVQSHSLRRSLMPLITPFSELTIFLLNLAAKSSSIVPIATGPVSSSDLKNTLTFSFTSCLGNFETGLNALPVYTSANDLYGLLILIIYIWVI